MFSCISQGRIQCSIILNNAVLNLSVGERMFGEGGGLREELSQHSVGEGENNCEYG
jgi:hypothetical protein